MVANITLVTALYDIRSREGTTTAEKTRRLQEYLELGRSMLTLDLPMVIFTDHLDVYRETVRYRMERSLHEKTLVIWLPFEETVYYKDLPIIQKQMKEYELRNRNPEKDTPLYVILTNDKFEFLERAMDLNPFGSDFFFWMDYGIQHCARASPDDWERVVVEWPPVILKHRDKIHQLRIQPVKKHPSESWKDYFRTIYHHVAASCFGGHRDRVQEYSRLFRGQWERMIHEEGWYQLEEAVMTIVAETHPEKFRFWYGDYDSLITNFVVSKRSWRLCLNMAQFHLDRRQHASCDTVLSTLDDPMRDRKGDDSFFQKYLMLRITNDFYRHDKAFSVSLRSILLTDRLRDVPVSFLERAIPNVRHYPTDDAMRFFCEWSFLDPMNAEAHRRWSSFRQCHGASVGISWGNEYFSALVIERAESVHGNHCPTNTETPPQPNPIEWLTAYEDRLQSSEGVVFLYVCGYTSDCHDNSSEKQNRHDQDLVRKVASLRLRFPSVSFTVLALMIDRSFTESHEDLIPIRMFIPYAYSIETPCPIHRSSYEDGVCQWYQRMLSLPDNN